MWYCLCYITCGYGVRTAVRRAEAESKSRSRGQSRGRSRRRLEATLSAPRRRFYDREIWRRPLRRVLWPIGRSSRHFSHANIRSKSGACKLRNSRAQLLHAKTGPTKNTPNMTHTPDLQIAIWGRVCFQLNAHAQPLALHVYIRTAADYQVPLGRCNEPRACAAATAKVVVAKRARASLVSFASPVFCIIRRRDKCNNFAVTSPTRQFVACNQFERMQCKFAFRAPKLADRANRSEPKPPNRLESTRIEWIDSALESSQETAPNRGHSFQQLPHCNCKCSDSVSLYRK